MARDDAGEGRADAPWDFDLPDLGASATPEHHRRPRRQSDSTTPRPAPHESRPEQAGRPPRRGSEDPLDLEALDDDPIDQDDDDLIPHSAADLSTLGPRSSGPQLPDDVADDDLPDDFAAGASGAPDGEAAGGSSAAASSRRPGSRAAQHDDDLLPAWATGRPARRHPSGQATGPSVAPAPGSAGGPRGRDRDDDGRAGAAHDDGRYDDERYEDVRYEDAGHAGDRYADGPYDDGPYDGGSYDQDRRTRRRVGGREREALDEDVDDERYDDRYDDWEDDWEGDRDAAPVPLWRRRLADPRVLTRLLIPLALGLLLITALVLVVSSLGGGSGQTPEPGAAATEAAQSEDPFEGFSARPEDENADGASGPAARACGDALRITGSTDEPTYGEDADPLLIMTLENTGEDSCMVNAGTARMDYRVSSGSETIFDSEHCQIEGQDRPIELEPGQTESARMEWNRQRSAPGCAEGLEAAGPGGYELEVSLGEASADPVEFTLE